MSLFAYHLKYSLLYSKYCITKYNDIVSITIFTQQHLSGILLNEHHHLQIT